MIAHLEDKDIARVVGDHRSGGVKCCWFMQRPGSYDHSTHKDLENAGHRSRNGT